MREGPSHSRGTILAIVTMSALSAGCPYGADVEPAGQALSLRSSIVGTWVCDLDAEQAWADVSLGWLEHSAYSLTVRPRHPGEHDTPGPWSLYARPRKIGRHEVWTVFGDQPTDEADTSGGQYGFLRLEHADRDSLRWSVLGGESGDMKGHLDVPDGDALARLLSDPKETKPEFAVTCRRTAPEQREGKAAEQTDAADKRVPAREPPACS